MHPSGEFSQASYARQVFSRGLGDLWQWYHRPQVQIWSVLTLLAGLLLMPDEELHSLQAWASYIILLGNAVGPLLAHLLLAPGRLYRDLAQDLQAE